MLSVLDIFRVGIGPSSSHTVGPMRIARRYSKRLTRLKLDQQIDRIEIRLLGSLAWTGEGHGTPRAVLLGLLGFEPETIDLARAAQAIDELNKSNLLPLSDTTIEFQRQRDLLLDCETPSELHPNGMTLTSFDVNGNQIDQSTWYSTGGGFIALSLIHI